MVQIPVLVHTLCLGNLPMYALPNGGQIFVSRMEGPALSVPFHGLGLGQNLRP